jgi:hypothetical protein
MYAPGTRRHIRAALQAGATTEEIMEVLKLCVVQGVQACNPRSSDSGRGTETRRGAERRFVDSEGMTWLSVNAQLADTERRVL